MSASPPVLTRCWSHVGKRKHGYRQGRRLLRAALITARETGMRTRTYRCPDCGWWHVTTREEWER